MLGASEAVPLGTEFVADAVDGDYVRGVAGVGFELFAEVPDVGVYGAGGDLFGPDLLQDLVAGDGLVFGLDEEFQYLELGGGELDLGRDCFVGGFAASSQ